MKADEAVYVVALTCAGLLFCAILTGEIVDPQHPQSAPSYPDAKCGEGMEKVGVLRGMTVGDKQVGVLLCENRDTSITPYLVEAK